MFRRFTDSARRVLVLAQEEARRLGHEATGPEHPLLGITDQAGSSALVVLASSGISPQEVRNRVEAAVGRGLSSPSGHIPFTPEAKKVLERSLREALRLGHRNVGPDHLLLGIVSERGSVAARALAACGTDLALLRQAVLGASSPAVPPRASAEDVADRRAQRR